MFDLIGSEFSKLSHLRNVIVHQHAKFQDDQYMCSRVIEDQAKLLHLFRECPKNGIGVLKRVWISQHHFWWGHCTIITTHRVKNGADISLQFGTTVAESWDSLSEKPKNRTLTHVKIRGCVGEISLYSELVSHMTEPLVYIWWAVAALSADEAKVWQKKDSSFY